MSPSDCTSGMRVWYEPSPGIRFVGTVTEPPRQVGDSWVTSVVMDHSHYGRWRGTPDRRTVPAASLDCLHAEVRSSPLRTALETLYGYSFHLDSCEEPMTDTCTCGLVLARRAAREALR